MHRYQLVHNIYWLNEYMQHRLIAYNNNVLIGILVLEVWAVTFHTVRIAWTGGHCDTVIIIV